MTDEVQATRPGDIQLSDGALYRLARKPWGCACPGNGHDNCTHPHCRQTIAPGTLYVEYVGSAGAYESGVRYCLACGVSEFGTGAVPPKVRKSVNELLRYLEEHADEPALTITGTDMTKEQFTDAVTYLVNADDDHMAELGESLKERAGRHRLKAMVEHLEKLPATMTDPVDFDTSTDEKLEPSGLVPKTQLDKAQAKIKRVRIYATVMADSKNDVVQSYGEQILAFLEDDHE